MGANMQKMMKQFGGGKGKKGRMGRMARKQLAGMSMEELSKMMPKK